MEKNVKYLDYLTKKCYHIKKNLIKSTICQKKKRKK